MDKAEKTVKALLKKMKSLEKAVKRAEGREKRRTKSLKLMRKAIRSKRKGFYKGYRTSFLRAMTKKTPTWKKKARHLMLQIPASRLLKMLPF